MADNGELTGDLLAWAAARGARWPHLFASLIARYLESNHLTELELCARLGCDLDTLNRLRLCGRPDPDASAFALDINRVAGKLYLDANALAAIVREVDASETFRGAYGASPFSSTSGMLQAARDYDYDNDLASWVSDQQAEYTAGPEEPSADAREEGAEESDQG